MTGSITNQCGVFPYESAFVETIRTRAGLAKGTSSPSLSVRNEAGIAVAVFALLWWTDILPVNRWLLWNRLPLEPAPIWDALTPLVITYMTASIAITLIAFMRPRWVRVYEAGSLMLDMVAAVGLLRALTVPEFIVVTDPASPAAGLAPVLSWVLFWMLVVWMLVVAGSIASTILRWSVLRQHRLTW